MALRLNGATSGFVELNAPDEAGSNTLTLPDGNGTSGQYLQTDGSGGLSWQTPDANSIAVIVDQKSQSTSGGTFTSGAWQTRDLNTELFDPDDIVSISSNQFTLGSGTYYIEWLCPTYRVNSHLSRLYDVTNTAVVGYGQNAYSNNTYIGATDSTGAAVVTITTNTTYRIEHQCSQTVSNAGFGVNTNFTSAGEFFTRVVITKVA